MNRQPKKTLAWVDDVAKSFPFETVVACHFENAFKCTPKAFKDAFDFLGGNGVVQDFCTEDLAFLRDLNAGLEGTAVPPSPLGADTLRSRCMWFCVWPGACTLYS